MGIKRAIPIIKNILTYLGIIGTVLFTIIGYKIGLFSSLDSLQGSIVRFGAFAVIIFILVQIVQVIVPILPGAVGCIAGIALFGNGMGFLYNYIGICIGSIIVFMLSKRYGRSFVKLLVGGKAFEKYIVKTTMGKKFETFFACAIFLPVAPDDLLCYIAGLTEMKAKKFVAIILLGKPLSIALYSMGLTTAFRHLFTFIQ